MRLTTILTFLLLVSAFTNLKATDVPTLSKRKTIGFWYSPNISYRYLNNQLGNNNSSNIINYRNTNESPKYGYNLGLNYAYYLNEQVNLEIGLGRANLGYRNPNLIFGDDIDTSGYIGRSTLIYNFYYFDMPLKFQYAIGKGKWRFAFTAGFSFQYLTDLKWKRISKKYSGEVEIERQTAQYTGRRFNLAPMAGLGLQYFADDHWNIQLKPTYRYGAISLNNTTLTENLWSFGMDLGINYLFD